MQNFCDWVSFEEMLPELHSYFVHYLTHGAASIHKMFDDDCKKITVDEIIRRKCTTL